MILEVPFYDRIIYANIWKVAVGRVSLYLMDTDLDKNSEWDRAITHQLYGGDWENRLKQEYMLGIGGIYMLKKLGINQDIFHCNEGPCRPYQLAAFVQLYRGEGSFIQRGSGLQSARLPFIRFHTPVPASHDKFDEGLFGKYMYKFPGKLGISWDDLMDLGRENAGNKDEVLNECIRLQVLPRGKWCEQAAWRGFTADVCPIWKATSQRNCTWAMLPTVCTCQHGPTRNGRTSMMRCLQAVSVTISLMRKSGKPSTRCQMRKSGTSRSL